MQTTQLEIVILAAGLGERFQKCGGLGHKALAPVWDSRGTLHLLLERLASCIANKKILLTIVSGRFEREIWVAFPSVRIVHNPDYASCTLPQSLSLACANSSASSVLVLFADTLYTQQTLEILVETSSRHAIESEILDKASALVAVSPLNSLCCKNSKKETRVEIGAGGEILNFNDPDSDWQMAHAVVWPNSFFPYLFELAGLRGAHSQWQILQSIAGKILRPAARAIYLPAFASFDIDDCDDLLTLQHQHRIRTSHIEYFAKSVSKERTLNAQRDSLSGAIYQKRCESIGAAQHEFEMMQHLYSHRSDLLASPIGLSDGCLQLDYVGGIRLYDLLRCLIGHPREETIRAILLDRCIDRLRDMQSLLISKLECSAYLPYPFESKVIKLLITIADLIGLPFTKEVQRELAKMRHSWEESCVIPFRDATPKNIIIGIEKLSPLLGTKERTAQLTEVLKQDDAFWQDVPIIDIDFTSTRELTTPEDDVISLMAHGITYRSEHHRFTSQPLLDIFDPSPHRLDLTWFVRYLRFGGRKLLYKLLNPKGFAVRFKHDEPCFYFEQLPKCLSKNFISLYPFTFELLHQIRDCAERYRGYVPDQTAQDRFFQSLGLNEAKALQFYWQESPLEFN